MKRAVLAVADRISASLNIVAQAMVLILIASMLYEVVARYIFGAPTLWAFDIAYMSTGVLFVLGAAQALREDAHVRIVRGGAFLFDKSPELEPHLCLLLGKHRKGAQKIPHAFVRASQERPHV